MSPQPAPQTERVAGLDSLRFASAILVVLSHGAHPPLMAGADTSSSKLVWLLNGLINNFWNGSAAVIVFFVLSGFCIHWPYRDGRPLKVGEFLARRLLRIGLPLGAAVGLSSVVGLQLLDFNSTILWSLIAEIIYYVLYPLILPLARRVGFAWLVAGAYVLWGVVLWAWPWPNTYGNYQSYGLQCNWAMGLPCWMLGCWLAARMRSAAEARPAPSARRMWLWRVGLYGVMVVLSGLRFHTPLTYQYTLNPFALVVAAYLAREIAFCQRQAPARWLERAGAWSYSLYLTHMLAFSAYEALHLPNLGYFLNWVLKWAFVLALAYGFYRLVERPSHLLARRIGGSESRPRLSPA